MNGVIIYKSNYGTARQYAEWISQETGFSSVDIKKVRINDIKSADTVIFGSPVIAGQLIIGKWIKKRWDLLKQKKVVLYSTSGGHPSDPQFEKNFKTAFDSEMSGNIRYFPLGGRMVFAELSGLHKFFMNLGMKMQKDPEIRNEMGKDKDHVSRTWLEPLLEYVR